MSSVGEDPRDLMVNYIPNPITSEELRKMFTEYGEVESARVICDHATQEPKGYGFVKFKRAQDATRAIEALDGFAIYAKRLKVSRTRIACGNAPQQVMYVAPSPAPPVMNYVPMGMPFQSQPNVMWSSMPAPVMQETFTNVPPGFMFVPCGPAQYAPLPTFQQP